MPEKFTLKRFLENKETSRWKKILFWGISGFIGLLCLGIIALAGLVGILSIGLPDVNSLENLAAAQSTEIFDRNNNLLYTIHGDENREEVKLADISQYLVDATVALEDDSFWYHSGFDIWALGKVGMYEIFGVGSPRGGSTITQQYVKNTFLSSERTYTRKAKELILAIRMERAYSKEEIMELYLNRIPYGNNAYGVQKAAEIYFNKDAKDLTLAESALLAALPQAPTRYNPYGNNKYSHLLKEFTPEELRYRDIKSEADLEIEEYARGLIGKRINLEEGKTVYVPGRSDIVLKRMYDLDMITMDERRAALNETQTITFNEYREPIDHPHFVLYVKEILEKKYGKDVVEKGGLKVYTTLDEELQKVAEKASAEQGEINKKTYEADNNAVLAINAKTGEILAMVGSRDYFDEEIDGNVNVVLRPRQPGSSFKPIVYAQAFYNGYAPGNVIYDIPTKIGISDEPQNFDGKWQGQISIRQALAQSRNIPAIQTYFLAGEQDPIIDLAAKMGITTLNKTHSYGYPLAIGAGEVPLMELVTAYGTFANNGKKPELTAILKVENSNGDVLEEWRQKEFEEVIDPQIAYLINSILSDKERSVGKRLFIDGHMNAAKTGTSTKENKKEAKKKGEGVRPMDDWTIGYTPTIVTGVWVGNTDGAGLAYTATGYNTATPIYTAVMSKALEKLSPEPFPTPKGIKKVEISKASGKLPGPSTPAEMIVTEIFPSFSVPTEIENLFYEVKLDKISGLLATEFTPEDAIETVTFQNYEPIADLFNWKQDIIKYYTSQQPEGSEENNGNVRIGMPPTEYDSIHTAETALKAPSINIIDPVTQTEIPQGSFRADIEVSAPHGIERIEYYIDDKKDFFTTTPPYTGLLFISRFMEPGSRHLLVAKVIDRLGYSARSAIEIKIKAGK